MPRRKRSRNGGYKKKQLSFRLNKLNATGSGRPWKPTSKTVKSVTSTSLRTTEQADTEVGDHASLMFFDLTQWNAPVALHGRILATGSVGWRTIGDHATPSGVGGPYLAYGIHPHNHDEALADGYKTAVMKKAMFRLTIRALPGASQDFVVMWRFVKQASVTTFPSTTENKAIIAFNDVKMSSGWVWRRFSGNQSGGSIYPASGIIDIKIPSIGKIVYGLNEGKEVVNEYASGSTVVPGKELAVVIVDAINPKESLLHGYLCVAYMHLDGSHIVDQEVQIDIMHYCTVKLEYNLIEEHAIEEADDDGAEQLSETDI